MKSKEIKLINGDYYKGIIIKETENIIKLRISENEVISLNKRFIKWVLEIVI